MSACEQSSEELAQATTTCNRFRTVISENCVVVESEVEYVNHVNQSSVVASCDIYDFSNDQLEQITSYTIELDD